jgi:hypothetical protein
LELLDQLVGKILPGRIGPRFRGDERMFVLAYP